MLRRRTPQVLIGTALVGLGATALSAPAQADTTVTIQEASPGAWEFGLPRSFPSQTDASEISASGESVTQFTVQIVFTQNRDPGVLVRPFASEPNERIDGYLFGDEALTQDCAIGTSNCLITLSPGSPGEPSTTLRNLYINPDKAATSESFKVAFEISSVYLTFDGSQTAFTITYPTNPGDRDSAEPTATPAPHIQQFGVPELGTCDEAAGADLNWSGVASGGWGESWAQWANDGAGGAVCSRTLVYNASQGAWAVD